ncbi:MAG: hypothetical protein B7Y36_18940 [Novosphingobium sp. 28-62-57]|uniref:hypothetical protein n=1 Tax=unclassified Novosphingobium TaxID=2644732 RepID=UPI000BC50844|nr:MULTISPECIES: hypothetical protein [unclassified Novosphingobium]OYW51155.1 MAG: hypothetical protein B7Z34_02475 [Novosphingobium sp. 12-62-10]OYZ07724.1 MAG: hypothetical protein B7Y36_18940 [Novosphingobium sp. 28-62-57]
MSIWTVSYDLRSPGRNYEALYKALRSVPFAHILESVWLIEAVGPASRIRDELSKTLDANDGLIVVEIPPNADWAVRSINAASAEWLKSKRP